MLVYRSSLNIPLIRQAWGRAGPLGLCLLLIITTASVFPPSFAQQGKKRSSPTLEEQRTNLLKRLREIGVQDDLSHLSYSELYLIEFRVLQAAHLKSLG